MEKRGRSKPVAFLPSKPLRAVLEEIGVPEYAPFEPDPFQKEALEKVSESDVLVCAPTGAGKTWIAQEAMARRLELGQRCWYASPLKALSNAKYDEFRARFGEGRVGILTGDRKENPDAPIVVGTTEILRNQLYDAMERGLDIPVDMVVVDEAHYLSDPERGVVWEEVLIYLPPRVRLLLLSATIGNPQEICTWLTTIRGQRCALVSAKGRPVPLYPVFLRPDGRLGLFLEKGRLGAEVRRYLEEGSQGGLKEGVFALEEIVEGLRRLNMLPAIFFLKSRADCDRAVERFQLKAPEMPPKDEVKEALETILEEYPILRTHRQLKAVLYHRVASHHAGHLPQWKIAVERLMSWGVLDAIFSTSTVAAGVDFPARTVVIPQSDRFNGTEFLPLTATELQQMTGRAGRRGKDKVGFALFLPGRNQDLEEVGRLLRAKPEPLESQIQINFSMVLNLLLSHTPEEIRKLLTLSLANLQGQKRSGAQAPRGSFWRREYRLSWKGPPIEARNIQRGRLFVHRDGSVFVAIRMSERRGRSLCMAHKLGRRVKLRKGSLVLKGVHLRDIETLLPQKVELPPTEDESQWAKRLEGISIPEGIAGGDYQEVPRVPPELIWDEDEGGTTAQFLWRRFMEHLLFLKYTGFVDEANRLTYEGRWASRLRLDHPLLVAEAIRRGVFDGKPPEILAGLMAPFVLDRDREVFLRRDGLEEMAAAFDELIGAIYGMGRLLAQWGFPTPSLQFWPACACYLWARGVSWRELTRAVAIDEGDLVSLILRTADHLRQLCDLAETHPDLASKARLALRNIQREPAVYF